MGDRGPKSFNELDMIARNRVSRTSNRLANSDNPAGNPPDHLSSETQAWWLGITANFNFEPHQRRLLQACAEAWGRKEQARLALSQFGLTYEDAKGVLRARPEIMIERDSRTAFTRLMRELDLERVPPPGLRKPWDAKQSQPWERDV
jgi:phage terminase small subunit